MSRPHSPVRPFSVCGGCEHRAGQHDFLFTEPTTRHGFVDRYRCTKCSCGAQYAPRVYKMEPGESEEAFMDRITAS